MTTPIKAIARMGRITPDPRTTRDFARRKPPIQSVALEKPLNEAFRITLSPTAKDVLSTAQEVTATTVASSLGLAGYGGYKGGFFKRKKKA